MKIQMPGTPNERFFNALTGFKTIDIYPKYITYFIS